MDGASECYYVNMKIIKIGRSRSNDCVFSNSTVSGTHAILELETGGNRGKLRDLNSLNGTFVNDKRINGEVVVTVSDRIRFGSETTSLGGILARMSETKVSKKLPGIDRRTIGKSSTSQIHFSQDDVSRDHAVIYKTATGDVVIEDCGSTNGTYVNGVKITSKVLQPGDKVTITRNYPLEWESIFKTGAKPAKTVNMKKIITSVAAVLLVAAIGIGGYWLWNKNRTWSQEKIYKEYHSAVCWVYVEYGYKVIVDDKDITAALCHQFDLGQSEYVCLEDGDLKSGTDVGQGTAFFISEDGKLATNLHITRPWLFTEDAKNIEIGMNKILSVMALVADPTLSRSNLKIQGEVVKMCIIPDGLPISEKNAIEVREIKGGDDINKDVAIIQTETRSLPSQVKRVIDINNADLSEESMTEGRQVFTIGFPYGADLAMNSNLELKNQVHGGTITQNRGDYEFGHDAETAGGASGSPIFNNKGELIGIHHAGLTGVTGVQGFNMAVKAKYIQELLK